MTFRYFLQHWPSCYYQYQNYLSINRTNKSKAYKYGLFQNVFLILLNLIAKKINYSKNALLAQMQHLIGKK